MQYIIILAIIAPENAARTNFNGCKTFFRGFAGFMEFAMLMMSRTLWFISLVIMSDLSGLTKNIALSKMSLSGFATSIINLLTPFNMVIYLSIYTCGAFFGKSYTSASRGNLQFVLLVKQFRFMRFFNSF